MEQQQIDRAIVTDAVSPGAKAAEWVAPLQSIETFSIAEFTQQGSLPPGDDGLGFWTQS